MIIQLSIKVYLCNLITLVLMKINKWRTVDKVPDGLSLHMLWRWPFIFLVVPHAHSFSDATTLLHRLGWKRHQNKTTTHMTAVTPTKHMLSGQILVDCTVIVRQHRSLFPLSTIPNIFHKSGSNGLNLLKPPLNSLTFILRAWLQRDSLVASSLLNRFNASLWSSYSIGKEDNNDKNFFAIGVILSSCMLTYRVC